MIVKTRAVVLRETNFRDQSRICSLYSRDFGRLSVIIKGARNPKNRLCGLFSAGNILDVVIYRKSGRELQLASDATLVASPLMAEPDMERFAALYRIIDVVKQATAEHEHNPQLFTLLAATLQSLYQQGSNNLLLTAWFLLRLVSLLGFQPSLRQCVFSNHQLATEVVAMKLSELLFVMNPGGLALPAAGGISVGKQWRVPVALALQIAPLAEARTPADISLQVEDAELELLCAILYDYCAIHLEHTPKRRHLAITAQLAEA